MKLLIFADLNDGLKDEEIGMLKNIEFDLGITLGDINKETLIKIKDICKEKEVIGILGDHDEDGLLDEVGITDIHNKITEIKNIKFLGFSGCLPYKRMNNIYLYSQLECSVLLDMAGDAYIFISHNSPNGIHDNADTYAHMGYRGIVEYMDRVKPILVLHGHQHVNKETMYEGTAVVGVQGVRLLDTSLVYPTEGLTLHNNDEQFEDISFYKSIHFEDKTRDIKAIEEDIYENIF
jgi:hypothetical protein